MWRRMGALCVFCWWVGWGVGERCVWIWVGLVGMKARRGLSDIRIHMCTHAPVSAGRRRDVLVKHLQRRPAGVVGAGGREKEGQEADGPDQRERAEEEGEGAAGASVYSGGV